MSVATPDQQPAGGLLLVNVTVYDGLRYLYQHVFDDMVNGTLKFNIFHWGNRFQSHLKIQVNMQNSVKCVLVLSSSTSK